MCLANFSHWLGQMTQPSNRYYHPVQVMLFASLSYTGTACLTSIPPMRGLSLAVLSYAISQLILPFFRLFLEPYQEVPLVPLLGQVIHLSTVLLLAKVICHLVGQPLSCKEIRKISLIFIMSLFVMKFALRKFRQQLTA